MASKAKAKAKPAMAVMIGLSPTKKMAKGGKMGYASGGMAMVKKDGKMVPSFAADGVGKMAKGGKVSAPIKEYGGKEKYASKTAMMKNEKKESPKMEKKEKKMAFGGYADEGGGGQPMNARQQQTQQALMQANKASSDRQQAARERANLTRANQQAARATQQALRQTAGNAAQQAAMANARGVGNTTTSTLQAKQLPAGSNAANYATMSGGGPRALTAEEAKRMGLGMAKGGVVKKKPMKGVINKFV